MPERTIASSYRREERDGRHVLFLTEARPGAYEIYQVTGANREFVESVPADGLVEVIKFAQAKAGDQNLWLEKLADQGPAVLLPKAK